MQTIRLYFTRRNWNPVSVGIRAAVPDSFCKLADASHCLIQDGDYMIQASMLHGVCRLPTVEALKGCEVVAILEFVVPDADTGLAFGRAQLDAYTPPLLTGFPPVLRSSMQAVAVLFRNNYDFKGAFGLGLAPGRDWQDPSKWFCFELAAAILKAAGLDVFADTGRISGHVLMQLKAQVIS